LLDKRLSGITKGLHTIVGEVHAIMCTFHDTIFIPTH